MGRRNLDSMRAADLAWNERRWDDYASAFDEEAVIFSSGMDAPCVKAALVARAKAFCETFPDAHVNMTPYLDLFISHDGSKTCSVAALTGTMEGGILYGLQMIEPNHRRFSVTLMAICKWRDGKILEQRRFFDTTLFAQQIEIPAR